MSDGLILVIDLGLGAAQGADQLLGAVGNDSVYFPARKSLHVFCGIHRPNHYLLACTLDVGDCTSRNQFVVQHHSVTGRLWPKAELGTRLANQTKRDSGVRAV